MLWYTFFFNGFYSSFFYFALLFLHLLFSPLNPCLYFFSLTSLVTSPFSHLFILNFFTTLRTAYREMAREGEGPRSMFGLHAWRRAAGWIGVIDRAQSIFSARLLGLCGRRLFLNYYRRQMLVRRCSLSRLDCFTAASHLLSLPLSHLCFLHFLKFVCFHSAYLLPLLFLSQWLSMI